jgi:hypothetical protein
MQALSYDVPIGEAAMGIFDRLFGSRSSASGKSTGKSQLPEVEASLGRTVVDFHDRTKLHYVLIFPVVHKMAVKLFVEDFGIGATLKHYESLVALFTSGRTIRESQFKSFGWPEVPPENVSHTQELDAELWRLARSFIASGILKETIATALVNVAVTAAAKGLDPLVSVGFLITILKELRAGMYTPTPEVRPDVDEGTDEPTTQIFKGLRDVGYIFRDHVGLEWNHLLPGMQSAWVICTMRFLGKERTLELFREQVNQLAPFLAECPKNPPQERSITPLHVQHMATFNKEFLEMVDSFLEIPGVHPSMISHALSMLIPKLTVTYYDLIFLSAIVASSCTDIERGKYDFVKKTH